MGNSNDSREDFLKMQKIRRLFSKEYSGFPEN